MTFNDELLLNEMAISLYFYYHKYKTATDISRWVVGQVAIHEDNDTILNSVFWNQTWLKTIR